MKIRQATTTQLLLAAVLTLGFAVSSTSAQVLNDFNSSLQSWRYDFGAGGSIVHDPTEGSPGNATGAAKLTFNFPGGGIAFTGDLFGTPTDLTGSSAVMFDVKVDPSSSLDAFGNYGYLTFVSRETVGTNSYSWGGQPGRNLPPSLDWQTFSVPTTANGGLDMTATRAFTLQLYGGGSQNIPGPVTLWLDNVRLAPVPEPASLALFAVGCASLLGYRRRTLA